MKQIDDMLDLGSTIWQTKGCFYCGEPYERDCWYTFEKIGNRLYQVPCCEKCNKKFDEEFVGEKNDEINN